MNWLGFLKTIKGQSLYYNMTFAIISFILLFLPIFLGTETLQKIPEIVAWRQNYLPYILIVFIAFSVFGGGQFISKIVNFIKKKKTDLKLLEEKKSLLSKIERLSNHNGLKGGFKSQDECIQWSNMVAPLLKFNPQYYSNFVACSHRINIKNISADFATSLLNTMKSQIQMAIEDLKNDIKTTQQMHARRHPAKSRWVLVMLSVVAIDD